VARAELIEQSRTTALQRYTTAAAVSNAGFLVFPALTQRLRCEEVWMPFDGAEFLRAPLPSTPLASPAAKAPWHRRWRSLFTSKGPASKTAEATPEGGNLAVLRVLKEAKRLIEVPQHWTRGTYESLRGRYCAVGALQVIGRRLGDPAAQHAAHNILLSVAHRRGFRSVEKMNDRSTHEQVLAAFDEAMAAARQQARVPEAIS
jgi:hypothetical protein